MLWRLADAKNRFSEMVNRALAGEPQVVVRRNDAVVVIARRDYERLMGKRLGFKQFLLGKGPILRGLDLNRDKSPMRKAKLVGNGFIHAGLKLSPASTESAQQISYKENH